MKAYPSWSPYVYTYNNPIRFTDSTGMCPDGDCPEPTYEGQTKTLGSVNWIGTTINDSSKLGWAVDGGGIEGGVKVGGGVRKMVENY